MKKILRSSTAALLGFVAIPAAYTYAGDCCGTDAAEKAPTKMAAGDSCDMKGADASMAKADCAEMMQDNCPMGGKKAAAVIAVEGMEIAPSAALAKLRSLAGDWTGETPESDEQSDRVTVNYRVTGAGSAVVETLFEGTPHEMVSVYHMDGDQLVMTHYCAAGNQPRLRMVAASESQMVFDFVDGTNIQPGKGVYINGLVIEIDGEHLHHQWASLMDGVAQPLTIVDLQRAESGATAKL